MRKLFGRPMGSWRSLLVVRLVLFLQTMTCRGARPNARVGRRTRLLLWSGSGVLGRRTSRSEWPVSAAADRRSAHYIQQLQTAALLIRTTTIQQRATTSSEEEEEAAAVVVFFA